jgi:hypothetical protein
MNSAKVGKSAFGVSRGSGFSLLNSYGFKVSVGVSYLARSPIAELSVHCI